MRNITLLLLSTTLLFFDCANLDTKLIEDKGQRMPLEPISLNADADVYRLRVRLVRNETEETHSVFEDGEWKTVYETVSVPDHYLGVRLGNGIFLDNNGNLSIDLVEFYNIDKNNFIINWGGDYYKKINNAFTHDTETAKIENNRIMVTKKGFFSQDNIEILKLGNEISCTSDSSATAQHCLKNDKVAKINNKICRMDGYLLEKDDENNLWYKNLHITHNGTELIIEYKKLFYETYYFFRTKNGFTFYDVYYRGGIVEKNGNKISIFTLLLVPGGIRKVETSYILLEPSPAN